MSWVHNVHGYAQLAHDLIEGRPITAPTSELTTLATRVKTLRDLYAKEYTLQEEFITEGIRDLAGVDLAHAQERNLTWQKDMGLVLLRIDAGCVDVGLELDRVFSSQNWLLTTFTQSL